MLSSANRWRVLGQVILGFALTFLFFYTMAPFMIALVISAVIALICHPWYLRFCKKLPAALSGVLITASITVLVLAPLVFVGISVAYRLADILRGLKIPTTAQLNNLTHHPAVLRLMHKIPSWLPVNREWVQEQALAAAQLIVQKTSELVGTFLTQLPGVLLGLFVVIVAVYFFIVDGARFLRFLESISPLPEDKSQELFLAFASSCRGVVLGMVAAAGAQGFLIGVFFAVTGMPYPVLWGFIGIIMGMVPVIGVAPVVIGGIIYQFATGAITGGVVLIIGAVVIGFVDNLIRPWVLKGHGEMHPLLGLVSAFGAVSMMGPTGIIIGPIIAAVFVAFLEILSNDLKPVIHSQTTILPPNAK